MKLTPEQIAAERARLLKILAIDKPHAKPGSRNRIWQDNRDRARGALSRLDLLERGFENEEDDFEYPL